MLFQRELEVLLVDGGLTELEHVTELKVLKDSKYHLVVLLIAVGQEFEFVDELTEVTAEELYYCFTFNTK